MHISCEERKLRQHYGISHNYNTHASTFTVSSNLQSDLVTCAHACMKVKGKLVWMLKSCGRSRVVWSHHVQDALRSFRNTWAQSCHRSDHDFSCQNSFRGCCCRIGHHHERSLHDRRRGLKSEMTTSGLNRGQKVAFHVRDSHRCMSQSHCRQSEAHDGNWSHSCKDRNDVGLHGRGNYHFRCRSNGRRASLMGG